MLTGGANQFGRKLRQLNPSALHGALYHSIAN